MVGTLTLCPPLRPINVIASVAKQSISQRRRSARWITSSHPPSPARRASADKSAPRNDAVGVLCPFKQQMRVRVLAARPARGLRFVVPPKGGSRECRMRAASAVSCAKWTKENAHEHTGSAEAIRHSLRNGFTAYFALSPENRALLSPSPADSWLIRARSGRLAFRRLDANR
jgi:hypothetical protein